MGERDLCHFRLSKVRKRHHPTFKFCRRPLSFSPSFFVFIVPLRLFLHHQVFLLLHSLSPSLYNQSYQDQRQSKEPSIEETHIHKPREKERNKKKKQSPISTLPPSPMAEQDQPAIKKQTSDLPAQKKILSNFLYKTILFAIFIALLPLFPSHNSTSTSPTLLSRTWELIHLVLVGVAVSYGLFSQRNADPEPDKDIDAAALKADSPHSYVSRLLQISPVFDEDSIAGETKLETWSSQYRGPDPVVVESKPLLLPVRNLMKSRIQNPDSLGVLPSPIPWKSRSRLGTMDVEDEDPTIAASSPPPSVYAGFFSPEMRGKTSEDYIGVKNLHGAAPPAPPPPPPPPPFNHASLSSERKEMKKSIKDELKDLRIKGREGFFKHSSPKSLRTLEKPPDLQKNPTETKKMTTKKKKVEFMEKMIVMSDDSETEKGSDSCADEDGENSSTETRSEAKENEVDKKADEFIAKFREQIRLQRIESIKKSSKHRAVKNNNNVAK